MQINVLSLFDGISCARVAIERAGIKVGRYYSSEVDMWANQISKKNWPDTIYLGNVKAVSKKKVGKIDLLIGGSPCQDLSIAKSNREGLKGSRSNLFFEYVRILKEVKPKWFILENVASMPKEDRDIITKTLGVEPIMIDAALVSAQTRKRYFWTNIPNIVQPKDREIFLKDILEDIPIVPKGAEIREKSKTVRLVGRGSQDGDKHEWDSVFQYRRSYWRETKGGKVPTLTANMGTGGNNVPYIVQRGRGFNKGGVRGLNGKTPTISSSSWQDNNHLIQGKDKRKLTPIECERLQCLPDNYTQGVPSTKRYETLGNAFNVEVVAHILKHLCKQKN